jgi:hypothetical protein
MKPTGKIIGTALVFAALVQATELKVDLNPPASRKDVLTPHWENWTWHEGASATQAFGAVTVTFRTATNEMLSPVLFKSLLDSGATMAADGIVVKNLTNGAPVEMVISGLAAGKHTITTYHNEIRDLPPAKFSVLVGGTVLAKDILPTKRATNDYEVASAFVEVNAVATS